MKEFLVLFLCLGLMGCATLGAANKINNLSQGMTTEQVRSILGSPLFIEHVNNKLVWKYSLHKWCVGWIPYYLTFDEENKLVEWAANQTEYYQDQQRIMDTVRENEKENQKAQALYQHSYIKDNKYSYNSNK